MSGGGREKGVSGFSSLGAGRPGNALRGDIEQLDVAVIAAELSQNLLLLAPFLGRAQARGRNVGLHTGGQETQAMACCIRYAESMMI